MSVITRTIGERPPYRRANPIGEARATWQSTLVLRLIDSGRRKYNRYPAIPRANVKYPA
jgi:hypothetical protein